MVPDVDKACQRFEEQGVEFVKKPNDGKMKGKTNDDISLSFFYILFYQVWPSSKTPITTGLKFLTATLLRTGSRILLFKKFSFGK